MIQKNNDSINKFRKTIVIFGIIFGLAFFFALIYIYIFGGSTTYPPLFINNFENYKELLQVCFTIIISLFTVYLTAPILILSFLYGKHGDKIKKILYDDIYKQSLFYIVVLLIYCLTLYIKTLMPDPSVINLANNVIKNFVCLNVILLTIFTIIACTMYFFNITKKINPRKLINLNLEKLKEDFTDESLLDYEEYLTDYLRDKDYRSFKYAFNKWVTLNSIKKRPKEYGNWLNQYLYDCITDSNKDKINIFLKELENISKENDKTSIANFKFLIDSLKGYIGYADEGVRERIIISLKVIRNRSKSTEYFYLIEEFFISVINNSRTQKEFFNSYIFIDNHEIIDTLKDIIDNNVNITENPNYLKNLKISIEKQYCFLEFALRRYKSVFSISDIVEIINDTHSTLIYINNLKFNNKTKSIQSKIINIYLQEYNIIKEKYNNLELANVFSELDYLLNTKLKNE